MWAFVLCQCPNSDVWNKVYSCTCGCCTHSRNNPFLRIINAIMHRTSLFICNVTLDDTSYFGLYVFINQIFRIHLKNDQVSFKRKILIIYYLQCKNNNTLGRIIKTIKHFFYRLTVLLANIKFKFKFKTEIELII